MARGGLRALARDEQGAVAATYALALFGLIAVAGVGFDYARLATMDSELQNAADQAALAAATQLDGQSDAITRATAQASNLVSNRTLLANDGVSAAVTVSSVTFYTTKANAEAGTNPTTSAAAARYVTVAVTPREAFYALTPVVGAISSGDVNAAATAGLSSAICREPPLFVCKPTTAITDANTWINSQVGKGILLKAKGTSWLPGNFGFLETNAGSGANDISKLLAYSTPPGDCVSIEAPETAPGQKQSVVPDFNTRFDIYEQGDSINCYSSNSLCPPAENSRKDIVQPTATVPSKSKDCNSPSQGWVFSNRPYRPLTAANITTPSSPYVPSAADFPDAMGHPRDLCHAIPESDQNCSDGFIGNGQWDINAYWWANYGVAWAGQVSTSVSGRTYPTRYEVYEWEKTNANSSRPVTGSTMVNYKSPICRAAPSAGTPDRRVIPIAVVDCSSLGNGGGSTTVYPIGWMNVFLVEPSLDRTGNDASNKTVTFTSKGDFYGEIMGVTGQGTGNAGNQVVRRDKPFLVK